MATFHLERFHGATVVGVARGFVLANLRLDSVAHLALGERRLFRLDLLVRRAGRNPRRRASPQNAAWPILESPQHARTGNSRRRPLTARSSHRRMARARLG